MFGLAYLQLPGELVLSARNSLCVPSLGIIWYGRLIRYFGPSCLRNSVLKLSLPGEINLIVRFVGRNLWITPPISENILVLFD